MENMERPNGKFRPNIRRLGALEHFLGNRSTLTFDFRNAEGQEKECSKNHIHFRFLYEKQKSKYSLLSVEAVTRCRKAQNIFNVRSYSRSVFAVF